MDIKHLRLTALALLMGLLAVFTWANEPVCPAEHAVPLTQAVAASLLRRLPQLPSVTCWHILHRGGN